MGSFLWVLEVILLRVVRVIVCGSEFISCLVIGVSIFILMFVNFFIVSFCIRERLLSRLKDVILKS